MLSNPVQLRLHVRSDLGVLANYVHLLTGIVVEIVKLCLWRIGLDPAVVDVAIDLPSEAMSCGAAESMLQSFCPSPFYSVSTDPAVIPPSACANAHLAYNYG